MRRARKVRLLLAGLSVMWLVPPLRGADTAAAIQRLRAASDNSALDVEGVKPWHVKIPIKLFDEAGKQSDEGTIEEWSSGPDRVRTEYRTGRYTATVIYRGDPMYRTRTRSRAPYYLAVLANQVMHPINAWDHKALSRAEVRTLNFGKVSLDCIMMSQPYTLFKTLPLGLFPTYCFDPGKEILRATLHVSGVSILRSDFVSFQGKAVSRQISVESGARPVATGQIVDIEEEAIADSQFVPSGDIQETKSGLPSVSADMVQPTPIFEPPPHYPEIAAARNASGAVVLSIDIAMDGHVNEVTLVSSPDPDLALAAIAAVRRYIFKPYTIDGQPIEIYANIIVNFEIPHSSFYAH